MEFDLWVVFHTDEWCPTFTCVQFRSAKRIKNLRITASRISVILFATRKMAKRVAVVTGSNTGIGLAIVRALCKELGENGVVYLTSRNEERGKGAVKVLEQEGLSPRYQILDVDDEASIVKLRDHIKSEHGGLDILVNNAGIMFPKADPTPFPIQAEKTIATNYFGLVNVMHSLLPLVRSGGRVVNVASMASYSAYNGSGEQLKKRFKEASTEQAVHQLMNEFLEAAKTGDHVKKGWYDSAYGNSKLGVVTLTRVCGANIADTPRSDILITSCCPGYVDTSMTAHLADDFMGYGPKLTSDQGAKSPVHLALLPPGTRKMQGIFISHLLEVKDFFQE